MKLLFIAPVFYGYEKNIRKHLDNRYDEVIYKNELPFNSTYYRAIKRISKWFASKILIWYNRHLINVVISQKVDKVFIIRGEGVLEFFFQAIKKKVPSIKIINYQWDSIFNNPNGLLISHYADENYSFDLLDVEKYNQFRHVPLFYCWDSIKMKELNAQPQIDIFFLGSFHSERDILVGRLKKESKQQGLILHSHIYIPWLVFLRKKLTGEKIKRKDVSFKKLSKQKYYLSIMNSKMVLDVQSPTQTGATIRSIETLSLGRKLISTNPMLKKELFYNSNNIVIWNTGDVLDLKSILEMDFDDTKKRVLLDIENWLDKLEM